MYMLKFYNISERFKQEINESKYKRWILENKGMLLISILIAIFLTISGNYVFRFICENRCDI